MYVLEMATGLAGQLAWPGLAEPGLAWPLKHGQWKARAKLAEKFATGPLAEKAGFNRKNKVS